MKKLVIPVILLLIVSLFAACGGQGGENTYTGDFNEYNDLSTSSDSANNSVSNSVSDSNSSVVTVPLTTQAGNTVPTIPITDPTTPFVSVDYTPIVPDTTKPVVNTSYYVDPNTTTTLYTTLTPQQDTSLSINDTTTTTTESTTKSELKYVKITGNDDTDLSSSGTAGDNLKLILSVNNANLTGKVVSGKGEATLNLSGEQYKVTYKVQEKRDSENDDAIVVTFDVSDLEITDGDIITVVMPKGAIRTEDNVANQKFTSGQYWY